MKIELAFKKEEIVLLAACMAASVEVGRVNDPGCPSHAVYLKLSEQLDKYLTVKERQFIQRAKFATSAVLSVPSVERGALLGSVDALKTEIVKKFNNKP